MKLLIFALALLWALPAQAQTQTTASAVEQSHVFCTIGCQVSGGQVNTDSTGAAWIILFDANAPPTGAGASIVGCTVASTGRPCALKWYQIAASSTLGIADFRLFNAASRIPTSLGFVAACSSTGPFTLTYTPHCVFSFEIN